MARQKLTLARIDKLECPPGKKDVLVFDAEQRGLAVRVSANGGKTYLAQYTFQGQKRRVPLGSCSAVSLADARDAARVVMGAVAQGRDPAAERKEAAAVERRKTFTLDHLLENWKSLHLASKRERYAAEAERALRLAFKKHLDRPADSLGRADVVKRLDEMASTPAMAARTRSYGRAAFSWAMKRGAVESNPFDAIPTAPANKRDRVLSDDELVKIWRATDGAAPFNQIVRLLILTGQRREEVAGMAWEEVSDDLSTWTLPADRAKNGAVHIVPLPDAAQVLLGERRKGLVFPGKRGAFSGWSKSKAELDKRSGVDGWRLHDLRRTVATGLQRLGVRLEVTEQILNHVSGTRAGIVGIYQRHNFFDEKRAALVAWTAHVEKILIL